MTHDRDMRRLARTIINTANEMGTCPKDNLGSFKLLRRRLQKAAGKLTELVGREMNMEEVANVAYGRGT